MPVLPTPPDISQYADVSEYGFYLEAPSQPFKSIDEIVNSAFYVALYLSPRQLSYEEQLATAITFTQGGGKFVESRGNLVKQVMISGTTGYLPQPQASSVGKWVLDRGPGAEQGRAKRSGYAAFYTLRQLFRTFGHQRRLGVQILMHFFDAKGNDFWQIEPTTFSLRRSSSQPMSYNYEVHFTCLEPSQLAAVHVSNDPVGSAFDDLPVQWMNPWAGSVRKVSASVDNTAMSSAFDNLVGKVSAQLSPAAKVVDRFTALIQNGAGSLKLFSGTVQRTFQGVLNALEAVVQAADDVGTTVQTAVALRVVLGNQVEDAIAGCFQAWSDLTTPEERSSGANAELNEFLLEVLTLNDQMRASSAQADGSYAGQVVSDMMTFATARREPAATDLFTETGHPLAENPFLGHVGLEYVSDLEGLRSSDGYRSVVVLWGETIYDVARRTLGNVHRFVELVFVNQLNFPFVVASVQKKPPGTIAWGEYIRIPIQTGSSSQVAAGPPAAPLSVLGSVVTTAGTSMEVIDKTQTWRENQWAGYTLTLLSGSGVVDATRVVVSNTSDRLVMNRPWSVLPVVGDQFSVALQEFSLRIPPTPEQVTFGRDILLAFARKAGDVPNPFNATLLLNSRGDLATVSGEENFIQAMVLMIATPQGFHPFHPRYGVGVPIGRPFTAAVSPLYTYFARQSLLSDPRVDTVQNIKLGFTGGAISFRVDVKPVNAHKAKQIDLSL